MTGRSLPYRAVSDSIPWPGGATPWGTTTGGTAAMEGGVNGALSVVIDAGPEGGARFMAGAEVSGTNAGGTGGGRSLNICAVAGVIPEMIQPASASASTRRSSRLD